MIPQANIIAWRSVAPWTIDAHVEQDLVLSRALVEIFSDTFLQEELAFRGGTALHKVFFETPKRYSEDIDLVQIGSKKIGAVLEKIKLILEPWLGKPQWKQTKRGTTLYYKFETEIYPIEKRRLKIEINTREHFAVLGFQKKKYTVENPWFSGEANITTYQLEELLGSKLRALSQRKKGRDLFDLDCALSAFPNLDAQKIFSCFKEYISFTDTLVSLTEFKNNLDEKLSDEVFINDIFPLLPVGVDYAVERAAEKMKAFFML